MMEWVLILTFYASTFSTKDSIGMTSIGGFSSEQQCKSAGEQAKKLETMMKSTSYVCVMRGKP